MAEESTKGFALQTNLSAGFPTIEYQPMHYWIQLELLYLNLPRKAVGLQGEVKENQKRCGKRENQLWYVGRAMPKTRREKGKYSQIKRI